MKEVRSGEIRRREWRRAQERESNHSFLEGAATLFRRDSVASKVMRFYTKLIGQQYLISVLWPNIRYVCLSDEMIEVPLPLLPSPPLPSLFPSPFCCPSLIFICSFFYFNLPSTYGLLRLIGIKWRKRTTWKSTWQNFRTSLQTFSRQLSTLFPYVPRNLLPHLLILSSLSPPCSSSQYLTAVQATSGHLSPPQHKSRSIFPRQQSQSG